MIKKIAMSLTIGGLAAIPTAGLILLFLMTGDSSGPGGTTIDTILKWLLLATIVICLAASFYIVFGEKGPFSKEASKKPE